MRTAYMRNGSMQMKVLLIRFYNTVSRQYQMKEFSIEFFTL